MTNIDDLEKLAELHEKGILTKKEFDEQKKKFLSGGQVDENKDAQQTQKASAPKSGFECYKDAWRKYAQFSGRASRSEYWYFVLFNFLIMLGISMVELLFAANTDILSTIYSLAVFIPSLAVYGRRYHDIGKSCWFAFVPYFVVLGIFFLAGVTIGIATGVAGAPLAAGYMMPLGFGIAGIILLIIVIMWQIVFPCMPSQEGKNQYGEQP